MHSVIFYARRIELANDLDVRHVAGATGRHKYWALGFFAVVVATVGLVTFLLPKTYRSEGKLFLRLGRENTMLDPTASLGQEPVIAMPYSRENEINSVVEILQGRALLEKVVDAIGPAVILGQSRSSQVEPHVHAAGGLAANARDRAVRELAGSLKVAPVRKTNIVQISCQARTAELAQQVVAKLLDLYVAEHIRLNRPPEIHQFLVQQTGRLQDKLSQKERQLRDLKSATGIASTVDQRQAIVKRINRLEDDLFEVEVARAAAAQKVQTLRKQLTDVPEMRLSSQTLGVGDDGTDRMRDQFYALQLRREEAAAKYTAEHPFMQRIDRQLAAAKTILDRQLSTRTHATTTVNRQFEETQKALLEEEPVLASMQAKADMLRTQIAEVHREMKVFGRDELRIAQLEREVDTLQTNYRKYAVNLEQAHVDHALEAQRMSNISVAQPATFDPRPVAPHTAMNLALGLLVGAFGGVGLALSKDHFSPAVRRPRQSAPNAVIPVLGRIPYVPARRPASSGSGKRSLRSSYTDA